MDYKARAEHLAENYGTHELLTAYIMKTFHKSFEYVDDDIYDIDMGIERALAEKFEQPEKYVCLLCGSVEPNDEEYLWWHIQECHPDKYEEVQDWETPDMIEECYDGGEE